GEGAEHLAPGVRFTAQPQKLSDRRYHRRAAQHNREERGRYKRQRKRQGRPSNQQGDGEPAQAGGGGGGQRGQANHGNLVHVSFAWCNGGSLLSMSSRTVFVFRPPPPARGRRCSPLARPAPP
ncbi:MAG: hypothetical protein ACK56I_05555, partial [bacterium]